LSKLKTQLKCRIGDQYLPIYVRTLLKKLEDDGSVTRAEVSKAAVNFYETALEYLDEWASYYDEFCSFEWTNLNCPIPAWDTIRNSVADIVGRMKKLGHEVNEDRLYDQLNDIRVIVTSELVNEWATSKFDTGQRWSDVFKRLNADYSAYLEIGTLVEFVLSVPGTNYLWLHGTKLIIY